MRIRSVVAWLLPVITITGLSGCEIINPTEDTPAYLKINKITLDPVRSATESFGSASANISDAWVYANGKQIGVFELPATIPILEAGPVEIAVLSGVYADGMKTARFPYAFYQQFDKTLDLEPGKVTELNPETKFSPRVKLPLDINDEFSGKTNFRVPTSNPYTLEFNSDSLTDFPFANGSVGVIYANPATVQPGVIESDFNGSLPVNGSTVFLEFDYKASVDFKVGVLVTKNGLTTRDPNLLNVTKRGQWNKIYLNLTDDATRPENAGATFKIFFEMPASPNPKDYVALDNIRLLHF
jgi:hypothetical protein